MSKNLISLKQIRTGELQTFVLDTLADATLGTASLSGIHRSLGSGVSQVDFNYGPLSSVPFIMGQLGTSGAIDPFLEVMITAKDNDSCRFEFSAPTSSSNYYMDLLISV